MIGSCLIYSHKQVFSLLNQIVYHGMCLLYDLVF